MEPIYEELTEVVQSGWTIVQSRNHKWNVWNFKVFCTNTSNTWYCYSFQFWVRINYFLIAIKVWSKSFKLTTAKQVKEYLFLCFLIPYALTFPLHYAAPAFILFLLDYIWKKVHISKCTLWWIFFHFRVKFNSI